VPPEHDLPAGRENRHSRLGSPGMKLLPERQRRWFPPPPELRPPPPRLEPPEPPLLKLPALPLLKLGLLLNRGADICGAERDCCVKDRYCCGAWYLGCAWLWNRWACGADLYCCQD